MRTDVGILGCGGGERGGGQSLLFAVGVAIAVSSSLWPLIFLVQKRFAHSCVCDLDLHTPRNAEADVDAVNAALKTSRPLRCTFPNYISNMSMSMFGCGPEMEIDFDPQKGVNSFLIAFHCYSSLFVPLCPVRLSTDTNSITWFWWAKPHAIDSLFLSHSVGRLLHLRSPKHSSFLSDEPTHIHTHTRARLPLPGVRVRLLFSRLL